MILSYVYSVFQSSQFVIAFRNSVAHTQVYTEAEGNYWFGILNGGRRSQQAK